MCPPPPPPALASQSAKANFPVWSKLNLNLAPWESQRHLHILGRPAVNHPRVRQGASPGVTPGFHAQDTSCTHVSIITCFSLSLSPLVCSYLPYIHLKQRFCCCNVACCTQVYFRSSDLIRLWTRTVRRSSFTESFRNKATAYNCHFVAYNTVAAPQTSGSISCCPVWPSQTSRLDFY